MIKYYLIYNFNIVKYIFFINNNKIQKQLKSLIDITKIIKFPFVLGDI